MSQLLTHALRQFSLNLTEQDLVKVKGNVGVFELEIPNEDGDIIGCYTITADEDHSALSLELLFSFQDIDDYLEDVKEWIFNANQNIKLGCFKLTDDLDFLIYTHSIYTKDLDSVQFELISNMFDVASGICEAYIDDYISIFE